MFQVTRYDPKREQQQRHQRQRQQQKQKQQKQSRRREAAAATAADPIKDSVTTTTTTARQQNDRKPRRALQNGGGDDDDDDDDDDIAATTSATTTNNIQQQGKKRKNSKTTAKQSDDDDAAEPPAAVVQQQHHNKKSHRRGSGATSSSTTTKTTKRNSNVLAITPSSPPTKSSSSSSSSESSSSESSSEPSSLPVKRRQHQRQQEGKDDVIRATPNDANSTNSNNKKARLVVGRRAQHPQAQTIRGTKTAAHGGDQDDDDDDEEEEEIDLDNLMTADHGLLLDSKDLLLMVENDDDENDGTAASSVDAGDNEKKKSSPPPPPPHLTEQRREMARALAWTRLPLDQVAASPQWQLAPHLVRQLQRDGFDRFFPIQALVIPDMLNYFAAQQFSREVRDLCITAPTGSGKTLSYVLPILHSLSSETRTAPICRLRCLVVLPSRDLAQQVYRVFQQYCDNYMAVAATSSDSNATDGGNKDCRGRTRQRPLRVGLAIGGGGKSSRTGSSAAASGGRSGPKSDFRREQMSFVVPPNNNAYEDNQTTALHRLSFDPGNLDLALRAYRDRIPCSLVSAAEAAKTEAVADGDDDSETGSTSQRRSCHHRHQLQLPRDGSSQIDILVCTPGRLIDHLDNTPGFTLQHLQYLVVDEADRLLSQSYHHWIDRVIAGATANSPAVPTQYNNNDDLTINSLPVTPTLSTQTHGCSFEIEPMTWRRQPGATASADTAMYISKYTQPVQLRKILVSATLTYDPQKLATMRLINPKHYNVHQLSESNMSSNNGTEKYSLPRTLQEYTIECDAEQKPLVLFGLLVEKLGLLRATPDSTDNMIVVIFTSSLDSTHRLARLLQLMWSNAGYHDQGSVVEYSSALSQKERSQLVERCNNNNTNASSAVPSPPPVSVVVCSDGMSRGMDLNQNVACVMNYDVPYEVKAYVHRCGRTARAGRDGSAITLLKRGQVVHFHRMRNQIQQHRAGGGIQSIAGVKKRFIADIIAKYRPCLQSLRRVLEAEQNGDLGRTTAIPPDYYG